MWNHCLLFNLSTSTQEMNLLLLLDTAQQCPHCYALRTLSKLLRQAFSLQQKIKPAYKYLNWKLYFSFHLEALILLWHKMQQVYQQTLPPSGSAVLPRQPALLAEGQWSFPVARNHSTEVLYCSFNREGYLSRQYSWHSGQPVASDLISCTLWHYWSLFFLKHSIRVLVPHYRFSIYGLVHQVGLCSLRHLVDRHSTDTFILIIHASIQQDDAKNHLPHTACMLLKPTRAHLKAAFCL